MLVPLSVNSLQKNEVNNGGWRTAKVTVGSISFTMLLMFLDAQKLKRRLMPAALNLRRHHVQWSYVNVMKTMMKTCFKSIKIYIFK